MYAARQTIAPRSVAEQGGDGAARSPDIPHHVCAAHGQDVERVKLDERWSLAAHEALSGLYWQVDTLFPSGYTLAHSIINALGRRYRMSSLLELLTQQMGTGTVATLSQKLGADQESTQKAMSAALPLLMGALARNASKRDGAEALHRAVSKDHDGSILDDLPAFLSKPDLTDGNAILGHVLGNRRAAVETGVSKTSGLDAQHVTQLMAMIAPLVLGAIGRVQRDKKLDPGALSSILAGEQKQAERDNPALGGLASLLDADKDGQIADDIFAKIGKGILGSIFGGKRR